MKIALKHANDEFLVMTLKHVPGLTGFVNCLGTPKLWATSHENGQKMQKQ
jgi:hypothetical protein